MKESHPAYYSVGAGSAVVLLHCTLSSKNQWRALSGTLEGGHRVIAVDLYGYGETPMPQKRDGYTLLDEVELVQSLLERILPAGEPIHLVGHSYGGAVALCFSHRFPERIKTLTVFEPVAFHLMKADDPGLQPVLAMMEELGRLLAAGLRAEAAATFLDYWSGPGCFAHYPARVQQDFARRTPKLALDFQALTGTPLTLDDYRQLAMPVTVIAGRYSRPPALRVAEELCQVLPDCRLRWVESGHMGPVTNPELVNPIIVESLAPRIV
jgi:pimeloyl-ACP methyl ester carboxylesterase